MPLSIFFSLPSRQYTSPGFCYLSKDALEEPDRFQVSFHIVDADNSVAKSLIFRRSFCLKTIYWVQNFSPINSRGRTSPEEDTMKPSEVEVAYHMLSYGTRHV